MNEAAENDYRIYVRSHVARDLIHSAQVFKTDSQVVWEYVSNSLEYIDEGTNPSVNVTLDKKRKRIVVIDNGRGMDWAGLQNFFIMHGENIDRKKGKFVRGMFGTGKSAAFGIGEILRVTSIRNGKRSCVELHRSNIEKMNTEDPIPVQSIERETQTDKHNGTMIEIEKIHLKSFNQARIIKYIERHLAKLRNATVLINNHECEFAEPPFYNQKIFNPEGEIRKVLGDVELVIKISSSPLDQELRGISIYSDGIWHETTLAGNEGREMTQYIFGEIDVPALKEDKSPISPFDLSRSMKLNPSNEIVQNIIAFIGQKVDEVRRELMEAEKKRKVSEDAKKLAKQANAIARIINDDFIDFRDSIIRAKAKSGSGFDRFEIKAKGGTSKDELIEGGDELVKKMDETGSPGADGGERSGGTEPRKLKPLFELDDEGEREGKPVGGDKTSYMRKGGFNVQFKNMGEEEARALYVSDERTIYINTDHPQLVAARSGTSTEEPLFLRLSYEVAFSEYAIALAAELNANDQYYDPSEPIYSIRETINRIARKAADLFSV